MTPRSETPQQTRSPGDEFTIAGHYVPLGYWADLRRRCQNAWRAFYDRPVKRRELITYYWPDRSVDL